MPGENKYIRTFP